MGCTACTEPQCLYKGALYLYIFFLFILMLKFLSKLDHNLNREIKNVCPFSVRPKLQSRLPPYCMEHDVFSIYLHSETYMFQNGIKVV